MRCHGNIAMYKIYLSKRLCLNSIHRGLKLEVVDITNLYYSRMRRDYITPTVGIYHYKTDINPIMPLYLIIFISFTGCAMMVTLFVQIESVTRTTRDYIVRVYYNPVIGGIADRLGWKRFGRRWCGNIHGYRTNVGFRLDHWVVLYYYILVFISIHWYPNHSLASKQSIA